MNYNNLQKDPDYYRKLYTSGFKDLNGIIPSFEYAQESIPSWYIEGSNNGFPWFQTNDVVDIKDVPKLQTLDPSILQATQDRSDELLGNLNDIERDDLMASQGYQAQVAGLDLLGSLAGKLSNKYLAGTEDDINVNQVQDQIYGNTWGDVFTQGDRRAGISNTITSNRIHYDDVHNNSNLANLWDNNDYQFGVNKLSDKEAAAAFGSSVASGALKWGAAGAKINPLLAPWAAIAGGIVNGTKTAFNLGQGDKTADYTNALVEHTNSMQRNDYFTRARMNRKAAYRNFAEGGPLESLNGVEMFNVGGTHEENPYGGIYQGMGENGEPNLVEEGEVVYNDYVFSKRLKASKSLLKNHILPEEYAGMSFADIAKKLQEDSEQRPYDPISKNYLVDIMAKLQSAQEEIRIRKQLKQSQAIEELGNEFGKGGPYTGKFSRPGKPYVQQGVRETARYANQVRNSQRAAAAANNAKNAARAANEARQAAAESAQGTRWAQTAEQMAADAKAANNALRFVRGPVNIAPPAAPPAAGLLPSLTGFAGLGVGTAASNILFSSTIAPLLTAITQYNNDQANINNSEYLNELDAVFRGALRDLEEQGYNSVDARNLLYKELGDLGYDKYGRQEIPNEYIDQEALKARLAEEKANTPLTYKERVAAGKQRREERNPNTPEADKAPEKEDLNLYSRKDNTMPSDLKKAGFYYKDAQDYMRAHGMPFTVDNYKKAYNQMRISGSPEKFRESGIYAKVLRGYGAAPLTDANKSSRTISTSPSQTSTDIESEGDTYYKVKTTSGKFYRVRANSPEEAKTKVTSYLNTNQNNSTTPQSTRTSVRVSETVRVPGGGRYSGSSYTSNSKPVVPAPELITPATPQKPAPAPQSYFDNLAKEAEAELEPEVTTPPVYSTRPNRFATAAMLAPAVANIGQAFTDAIGITNRPDYTVAEGLRRNASALNPIAPKLNTDYQEYRPYDVNVMNAQLLAQEYGAQRAAREGSNRHTQAAQLLALNNAYGNTGFLANLQAQQANEAKRQAALQWNHGINKENAATVTAYDEINQGIKQQRLAMMNQALQAQDASDTARAQAISNNRALGLTDLGNLGRYMNDSNMTQALINSGVFGPLNTDMKDAYKILQLNNLWR